MFGPRLYIEDNGLKLTLRPFRREEMEWVAEYMSSLKITRYTRQRFGFTEQMEREWFDKVSRDDSVVIWAICQEGVDHPLGSTGIHNIDAFTGSSVSGIIIGDTKWWGKKVASTAHLGRTLFAADYLGRLTIRSGARTDNPGSLKALLGMGYHLTGLEPRTDYKGGRYVDTHMLCWLHPERIDLLFPEGLPEQYKEGVEIAQERLQHARKVVQLSKEVKE